MKRIELLAPAGNLLKLKVAIMYGADAVYCGGEKFSLRARANNFSLADIKEGVKFAHKHHAKVYITMNALPHDEDIDLNELDDYLLYLDKVGVDAIIASSITIITRCISLCKRMEAHVSTQLSSLNSMTCMYYKNLGVKRVVLGREASLTEISEIKKKMHDLGIEVFIHGGMCSSYSGRCMLSNHMVNRDANRGGCAHSCRWNYHLYDNKGKINKDLFFNIGSKDLMALKEIPLLIEAGVDSLKIEGRMKSEYYIATVVRSYRMLIDEYYKTNTIMDYNIYETEIRKAENRLTSTGFLNGDVTINEQLYDRDDHPTKEFVGVVAKYNRFSHLLTLIQRNYFKVGDTLEFFGPNTKNTLYEVEEIYDESMNPQDCANHPEQIIKMHVPFKCEKGDMIRLKIN